MIQLINELQGAEEYGVISCRFWLSGFVALLGNNTLVSVSKYHEPRPKLLAKPPETHVSSWTLIPPSQTLSRSEEVLLAINETVYVVDPTECEDRQINRGPFKHISISPNGKFVALLTDDGKVLVASSDFQSMLSEYDSKFSTPPKDLKWCGNNAVVLAWEDEIHLIGPNGASTKYESSDSNSN
jgi:vacuolar protein sorting-associated protein 16